MKLIIVLIIVYVILFMLINFTNLKIVLRIKEKINENIGINSWLTTLFIVGFVGAVFTYQNNQNNQKQVEIANRETAPLFYIEKRKSNDGIGWEYYISNDKGIASYVTFSKYANFSFRYKDEPYRISLYFFNDDIENDESKQRWVFSPVVQEYDKEYALEIVKSYLLEKTGEELIVNGEIILELGFIDYKNDKFNFSFNEYEDRIRLTATEANRYYSEYPHNRTIVLYSEEELESTIKSLIEGVLQ